MEGLMTEPNRHTPAAGRRASAILLTCIAVATIVFLVFSPSLRFGFLNWDDDIYVYNNPLVSELTAGNIAGIFSGFYYYAYIPVTLLSHAVDVAIWGMNPAGHHLTNVLLHSFNAGWLVILGLMILRTHGTPAKSESMHPVRYSVHEISAVAGAALLFCLHPLRIESVAWVSDRKDLLCAFFVLPSVIAYYKYASSGRSRSWYVLSLVLFTLGVLSKPVAVGLPLVLLMIDWTLARTEESKPGWRILLAEKIPFFAVSAVLAFASLQVSPDAKRASSIAQLDTIGSILFPFHALSFYLTRLIDPTGLLPIYSSAGTLSLVAGLVIVLGLTAVCLRLGGQWRRVALLVWTAYIIFLAPTIAGLSSGMQPVADRYAYLPTVSLFLALGVGFTFVLKHHYGPVRILATTTAAVLLVLWGMMTMSGLNRWSSSVALWSYTVENTPRTLEYVDAQINLGTAYAEEQRYEDAKKAFEDVLRVDPRNADAFYNLGVILYVMGQEKSSRDYFVEATKADPASAKAFLNLAIVLARLEEDDQAVIAMRRAAQLGSAQAREALRERGMSW